MHWIYLIIAAVFEAIWVYCVKFMNWDDIKSINILKFNLYPQYLITLYPLLGYIVFGILNVVFFSMAMRTISASVSLAVWMGASLIFVKIIDVFYLSEPVTSLQLACFGLILAGIVGLKFS